MGGKALAAGMYSCAPDQLTRAMVDAAISELLNMIAGQIQKALEIDQQLGLPQTTSLAEMAQMGGVGFDDSILLTSDGLGDLKLWISEKTNPNEAAQASSTRGKAFRSMFRKIVSPP